MEAFDERLFEYARKYPAEFRQHMAEYFRQLEEQGVTEYGHVVPSYFHPYVISQRQFREIATHTETMAEILFKVCELFMVKEDIRQLFSFDPELLEWMQTPPGYEMPIPVSRYDGYYDPRNNTLMFNEFNADGTSGMNQTNTVEEIFLDNPLGESLGNEFSLYRCDLRQGVLETLLSNYRKAGGNKETPNIAIVDWQECASMEEFEALKTAFVSKGFPTVITDPKELSYREGTLWVGDFSIDILYRRLVTVDLLERREEAREFLRAYTDRKVCTIGSMRTEVAHSKIIFCLLSDPVYSKYFSPAERSFLAEHIPWTRKLSSGDPELLRTVLKEQNSLLLKPHNAYASKGHIVGQDSTREEWEDHVRRLADTNYLVQEKIPAPEKELITTDRLEGETRKVNLGTYVFNGKLSGFYTRVSPRVIITTLNSGALIPTLISRR